MNLHSPTASHSHTSSHLPAPEALASLPLEVIQRVVEYVYYDNEYASSIIANLEGFSRSILPLNKALQAMAAPLLYRYANFTRPQSFDKFLRSLHESPELGHHVEVLDFLEFTSVGLGRTNRMMQEIQMVTARTILECVRQTPHLKEFLASESIQDDMDAALLTHLFNKMPALESVDFCGANSDAFALAFNGLTVAAPLTTMRQISFHDCTNLSADVFASLLPRLVNVERLDLSHTQITSKLLVHSVPLTARLTHLLLARCSKVTTNDLMQFLVFHPSVRSGALRWLNLQVDTSVVAPFTVEQLHELLEALNAPELEYLNLGGLPIDAATLSIIKRRFPALRSLTLAHAKTIVVADVVELLTGSQIAFLNVSGVARFTRFTILYLMQQQAALFPALQTIEFDAAVLQTLAYEAYQTVTVNTCIPATANNPVVFSKKVWKFFDNQGRRGWLHLLEPVAPNTDHVDVTKYSGANSLVRYNPITGKKILAKVEVPSFFQYASRKINCSRGAFNMADQVESKPQVERGIYKYYSLNVK